MHRHRGVLVHSGHVVADVAVNVDVQLGVEAAGDRVRAVGISHVDPGDAFRERAPVQKEIQIAQRILGEIEFAARRRRPQIRHV